MLHTEAASLSHPVPDNSEMMVHIKRETEVVLMWKFRKRLEPVSQYTVKPLYQDFIFLFIAGVKGESYLTADWLTQF